MDAAVNPVDHQIDSLVHFIASQPLGEDPTCDLLVRPNTMADVPFDPALFFQSVACERPMHGLMISLLSESSFKVSSARSEITHCPVSTWLDKP